MLKTFYSCLVAASLLLVMTNASAQMGGMGGGQGPDLTEAAEKLGVSQEELLEALGGPPPDFAAAAEKLGITEEALMEVMPAPPEGGPQ